MPLYGTRLTALNYCSQISDIISGETTAAVGLLADDDFAASGNWVESASTAVGVGLKRARRKDVVCHFVVVAL